MVRTEKDAGEPLMIVIMTTVANEADAEKLADGLVGNRLAACVQILPPMKSVYVWDDRVQRETEHLLLIKTLAEKYESVEALIRENHEYETPEILAIPVERGFGAYLEWVELSVGNRDSVSSE